jgi:hypothetical protein
MIRRCELPDEITLPGGEVLKAVIGGHLENKPFLTVEHSKVDVKQNGWAGNLFDSQVNNLIIAEAKRLKLKYRKVAVLSRNLRKSIDLHNRPYRPSIWVFVQVK